MTSRRTLLPLALAMSAIVPACNPYTNFDGEFFAGPIDATNFPREFLGELPGEPDQSGGTILARIGWVNDGEILFYQFSFTPMDPEALDPLTIAGPAKAYVFDPTPTMAFPDMPKCRPIRENYIFDQQKEAWRGDEQGVIFTRLPDNSAYSVIATQVPVTSNGERCQEIKSSMTLLNRHGRDVTVMGGGDPFTSQTDGKLLAFAIVDPAADVQPNIGAIPGLGPIHLGWYNKFLLAFIDGGYVPTEDVPAMGMVEGYTRVKTQNLYSPTQIPVEDDMGNMVVGPGSVGAGFDLLDAARGEAAYSPVCQVLTFVPDDPMTPKTSVADLSPTEMASATPVDFVYCLQPF